MSRFDSARRELKLGGRALSYHSLRALESDGLCRIESLPYTIRILLESLLRMQGHPAYTEDHVLAMARWKPVASTREEFPFMPARVLLQDFTGVPCIVDLAALRSAMARKKLDPQRIEPSIPVDLVIDHSVQLDAHGSPDALQRNMAIEIERNAERYAFLRWGQQAFKNLRVLPPGLGICHQVNMEYLATCVTTAKDAAGRETAFADTLVGTDSHTTMVNSMGVLGWGVGGIEAEAAMLGQPIPILTPVVIGVRLRGSLPAGATATDLALMVTQRLREKGVVGHFVEFFGPGLDHLSLAARAPVANMAPEYGATTGFFPVDGATLDYLRETGRSAEHVELVERYGREQGLFRTPDAPDPEFSDVVELDLAMVEPCAAGPKRPHDRMRLPDIGKEFEALLTQPANRRGYGLPAQEIEKKVTVSDFGTLEHGSVVIASITSCTNTSNPDLMLGAGLVAKKAIERGLEVPKYVKTSFAPGSRIVTEYLARAGLLHPLEALGFHVAAYGCATCIGNSGPLAGPVAQVIREDQLVAAAVLSGNRNFEGRIHPLTRANFLCSPALVVIYALRGTVRGNLAEDPIGTGRDGKPVYLKDLWPAPEEIRALLGTTRDPAAYRRLYDDMAHINEAWSRLPVKAGAWYEWDPDSTYIREPPFFADMPDEPDPPDQIREASCLALFGDFVTTDHISPAGSIPVDGPAGRYLISKRVEPGDFNSYGSRRGNHEVMIRGTFGNIHIRNRLIRQEGGLTVYHPTGLLVSIYDAARLYQVHNAPLIVIAGKMYGAGSSRDWAAKGTRLQGVRAVIAESFERIHRSNLVEMGVLPLEFLDDQNADAFGFTGAEAFTIGGLRDMTPGGTLHVKAVGPGGRAVEFDVKARIDSPIELEYYRHGGILPYVLRAAMRASRA
ncbi:MAG: aconitate hydratase AcnA [Kiritimatiellae bacterium]|nr:aconitate hydratase AcnA [Kiritimatiellia bacterium]